jgi:predicted O-methyltransferase YrrM
VTFAAEYEARRMENSDIRDFLPFLYEQAKGKQVIELGVRGGNSTAALLAAVERDGGHVWSVDIAAPHVPDEWLDSPLWDFVGGDDLEVVEELPDGVDVVFIDTSHTFQQTWSELDLYAPKLLPGGVFLLHDTELEHPDASPCTDPPYPVKAAVDQWAFAYGWVTEFRAGCNGLGIVHKPGRGDLTEDCGA